MKSDIPLMQEWLNALLNDELNSCADFAEQKTAIEAALNLVAGVWTIRFSDAPPDIKKNAMDVLKQFAAMISTAHAIERHFNPQPSV